MRDKHDYSSVYFAKLSLLSWQSEDRHHIRNSPCKTNWYEVLKTHKIIIIALYVLSNSPSFLPDTNIELRYSVAQEDVSSFARSTILTSRPWMDNHVITNNKLTCRVNDRCTESYIDRGHPSYTGIGLDCWSTSRAIVPAPGTWFIAKFISSAQVVPDPV